MREVTKLRADIHLSAAPGSLPNDGKVIDDKRPHHLSRAKPWHGGRPEHARKHLSGHT